MKHLAVAVLSITGFCKSCEEQSILQTVSSQVSPAKRRHNWLLCSKTSCCAR